MGVVWRPGGRALIPGVVASSRTIALPPDPGGSDPYWSKVSALLHFNGANGSTAFADEAGKAWSGIGGAAISTQQSRFNGSSLLLDGVDDAVISVAASDDFAFGTGDFTIEAFVFVTTPNRNYQTIVQPNSSRLSGLCAAAAPASGGTFNVFWYENGVRCASQAHPMSTWVHVAASRRGGVVRTFVDGDMSASTYADASNYATAGAARIGRPSSGLMAFGGNVAEVRITKGVARYIESFTPPVAPFPNS